MAGFNYPASKINAKQITKTLIFVQFCGRPPRRGAWIEMLIDRNGFTVQVGRPLRRGAWIEITVAPPPVPITQSLLAQGSVD